MPKPSQTTTSWVAANIAQMPQVTGTSVTSAATFRISRPVHPSFEVAVFSSAEVTSCILDPLLSMYPQIAFAVNVPKDAPWRPSGISSARDAGIGFGSIKDLMSAISQDLEDVREYKKKENQFVERGLGQHARVSHLVQESERSYTVHRSGLRPIRIVMLNEYELTAEHVRSAWEVHGSFSVLLKTNPNGSPTVNAKEVAKELGIQILSWSELWGRLYRR